MDRTKKALVKLGHMACVWLAAIGAAAMVSCSPPVQRAEPDPLPQTPTPTPPVTPHPASGARERAVQLYPDLAVKDSMLNRTFLDLMQQMKEQNPEVLTQVDWPLTLANRAARMLDIAPRTEKATPVPTPLPPTPPPPVMIYVTPRPRTLLEGGAYNQKRDVTATPMLR